MNFKIELIIYLNFIVISFINNAFCEVFTSTTAMEGLLHIEANIISEITSYLAIEREKLEQLQKKTEEYEQIHKEASKDPSTYLINPVNAFLLTKRITTDWFDLENLMNSDNGGELLDVIKEKSNNLTFPTTEDLKGVANALTRLQETYNLNTSQLANGVIDGVQYSSEMSANDCWELGHQSFISEMYHHAATWFREALKRKSLDEDNEPNTFVFDTLSYLTDVHYERKNFKAAVETTNELLSIQPNDDNLIESLNFYETKLINHPQIAEEPPRMTTATDLSKKPLEYDDDHKIHYAKLCRKEVQQTPAAQANVRCRYVTNNVPFLKIGPLKLEEISLDPYIVVYRNVLSDNEIDKIKKLSQPKMKRALIDESKEQIAADYRISKSSWIYPPEDYKLISTIDQRIVDMTGQSLYTAEALQIVNYGIGGHYEPHFDFALKDDSSYDDEGIGNRISTVLFYMSDVKAGGATVFPLIDVALWPDKGSAAYWINLYKSGAGDLRTKHAGCPVLVGNKWVCNKWIHTVGNELKHLCDMKPDHPNDEFH